MGNAMCRELMGALFSGDAAALAAFEKCVRTHTTRSDLDNQQQNGKEKEGSEWKR